MDSESLCRICLSLDAGQQLFVKHSGFFISDMIMALTNVNLKEQDGLPNRICVTCLQELETAVEFKKKCEDSDRKLRNLSLIDISNAAKERFSNELSMNDKKPCSINKIECRGSYSDDRDHFSDDDESVYVKKEIENPLDTVMMSPNQNTNEKVTIEIKPIPILEELYNTASGTDYTNGNETKMILCKDGVFKKSRAIDLQLICDDCGSSFQSKCKLRVHWKKAHLPEKLICQICKRCFKTYKTFNKHKTTSKNCKITGNMIITGIGKSRRFQCKYCSYSTYNDRGLETHLRTHSGERPYLCTICPKSFKQLSSLIEHKDCMHTQSGIPCQTCGKLFKSRPRLRRHLIIHKEATFACTVCEKKFKTNSNLLIHMRRHSKLRLYQCELCPKAFYTSNELYMHQNYTNHHSKLNNERFSCDKCEYKIDNKSRLKTHLKKHNDIETTNTICKLCGKVCSRSSNGLMIHMMKYHSKEKKLICPHCQKQYSTGSVLIRHIKSVHGLKKTATNMMLKPEVVSTDDEQEIM